MISDLCVYIVVLGTALSYVLEQAEKCLGKLLLLFVAITENFVSYIQSLSTCGCTIKLMHVNVVVNECLMCYVLELILKKLSYGCQKVAFTKHFQNGSITLICHLCSIDSVSIS